MNFLNRIFISHSKIKNRSMSTAQAQIFAEIPVLPPVSSLEMLGLKEDVVDGALQINNKSSTNGKGFSGVSSFLLPNSSNSRTVGYRIVFPDGRILTLGDGKEETVYQIGRIAPQHVDFGVRAVIADDGTGLVSRRHLRIGYNPREGLWIEDLRSANGTQLVNGENGEILQLEPMSRTSIAAPSFIRFGKMEIRIEVQGDEVGNAS